ncbi:hypothetical protein, partial [Streptomyces asiaticus]
ITRMGLRALVIITWTKSDVGTAPIGVCSLFVVALAENVIRPGRRPAPGLAVVGLVARVGGLAQMAVDAA